MKLQLASDLHLEFLAKRFPGERLITPHPEADVLVIAGDIASGADAVQLFSDWPVPVIATAGNHEFYGHDYDDVVERLRAAADGTKFHFLERDRFDVGEVRFLGCCLWTDYELKLAPNASRPLAMQRASYELYDHTAIRWPAALLSEHGATNTGTPATGFVRSLTSHGTGRPSLSHIMASTRDLLQLADFWLHGHVHDSFDYTVGAARVAANPRGYAFNHQHVNRAGALMFENTGFDPAKLIEVL